MVKIARSLVSPPRVVILIILFATAAVVGTYSVFSPTWDEPSHLAAGMELLDKGTYRFDESHPPLARLAIAAGPYLDGLRVGTKLDRTPGDDVFRVAASLLYDVRPYQRVLFLARLDNLPFLLTALIATYLFARRLLSAWGAVLATFFVATVPPVLGNAALATADIAPVGLGITSIYLFVLWLDRPSLRLSIMLGVLAGAAAMTKFTAIAFLGIVLSSVALWRWLVGRRTEAQSSPPWAYLKAAVVTVLAAAGVCWVAYGFSSASFADLQTTHQLADDVLGSEGRLHDIAYRVVEAHLPAFVPQLVNGMVTTRKHNFFGHPSFLLGELRQTGWHQYYLVVLAVKTPLPLLMLGVAGIALSLRTSARTGEWRLGVPAIAFLAILLWVSVFSQTNTGVRHVLILYPLLAISAAYVVEPTLWRGRRHLYLSIVVATVAWQVGGAVISYPDHMAYFNVLAGSKPEHVLLTADLDWGQDLGRLAKEVKARDIRQIAIAYNGGVDPSRHIPSSSILPKGMPVQGWVAASLWQVKRNGNDYKWLESYQPVARVGRSIDLYFVPSN